MIRHRDWYDYYKGYTVIQIRGEYRAACYTCDTLYNKTIKGIKQNIRHALIYNPKKY